MFKERFKNLKVAIFGSRNLKLLDNLDAYLPPNTDEIVSGGARGIDSYAKEYAIKNNITITEFLPEYSRYGKCAPLKRNESIVKYSDMGIAFWDGVSKGTKYTIDLFHKENKELKIIIIHKNTT